MKTFPLPLPALILLAACARGPAVSDETAALLQNPLYAEYYQEDLVDYLVSLEIQNDPLTQQEETREMLDEARQHAIGLAREATQKQTQGRGGRIISDSELSRGEALLLEDTLYLGPDFDTVPGLELHLFLSTVVDPRDGVFPDPSATDIGQIQTAYGAQTYAVPAAPSSGTGSAAALPWRTLALYDVQLQRLFGFVQLQMRQ